MSGPFSVLCSWANCDVGRRPMDGSRAPTYRGGCNEATQASSLFLRRRLDLIPDMNWVALGTCVHFIGGRIIKKKSRTTSYGGDSGVHLWRRMQRSCAGG